MTKKVILEASQIIIEETVQIQITGIPSKPAVPTSLLKLCALLKSGWACNGVTK